MCGIAGYSLKAGESDLTGVSSALRHRGPDADGIFCCAKSGVGLAHVRLSIIDLSHAGDQPMVSDCGRFVLSYNGEIYNYADHRAALQAEGVYFKGHSDTEVLLRLLERQGLSVLSKLNGMFAFALLDRESGEVTVVRDGFGIKPLYYSACEDGVYFSSEVRGLRALGVVPSVPDARSVARYVTYLWTPGVELPSSNIRKLEPGTAITLRDGQIVRHWKWFDSPSVRPKPKKTPVTSLVSRTADYLRSAVHRQMVADVPVGAFLSGGLDSSAVVAFARERAPDMKCFTIETSGGAEEGMTDDLPYAQRVASHLGVPLEVVKVDEVRMAYDLEEMIIQLEEPIADPACLNVLYISRLARQQGIKVLLSGSGGDDLFTGYRRHQAVRLDGCLKFLPHGLRSLLGRLGNSFDQSQPFTRRLSKYLNGIDKDPSQRLVDYFAWTPRQDVIQLFSKDLREQVTNYDISAPMRDYLDDIEPGVSDINRILALEQRFFLSEHNLVYTDKMSMAESLEVRVPFLDYELAEFSASIPDHFKQRGKIGKWILKKAMEPYLPHDVIYRPKTGFGAPLRRWMRGELREMMGDLLSHEALCRRGLFDANAVHRLMADDLAGRKDGSYTLLSLMCIEIWCRNFIDR